MPRVICSAHLQRRISQTIRRSVAVSRPVALHYAIDVGHAHLAVARRGRAETVKASAWTRRLASAVSANRDMWQAEAGSERAHPTNTVISACPLNPLLSH